MKPIKESILECRILIVEDDYLGRAVLKEIFRKQGFKRIEEAENGRECLYKIEHFHPDLIILDVIMPEMDGVECCKHIRAHRDPHIAQVPILVQTALDKISDKSRLFATGATDYVTKPVDPHEITARAVAHLEREMMSQSIREFNNRISEELEIARATQQVLIPNSATISGIERDYPLTICGHYQSCSELGGDFWGMQRLSRDELAVYMVDFSGHGVNAALNVFRLHALMQTLLNTTSKPSACLSQLNAMLTPLLLTGQYATMFYGVIDTKNHLLSYASAAAPTPILFSDNGTYYRLLENTGGMIGADAKSRFESREAPFTPGDCLLLFSDALIETPDHENKALSIESIATIFQAQLQNAPHSPAHATETLLSYFNTHHAARLTDDLTLSVYGMK